jgi:hypothetical protein
MSNSLLEVRSCSGLETVDYDCTLFAIGYEQRSTFIARHREGKAGRRVALGYDENRILRYHENRSWYASNGYEIAECSDRDFKAIVADVLSGFKGGDRVARVLIDISSLNRFRLATIVQVLRNRDELPLVADFAYCLAQYSEPPAGHALNRHVGPVIQEFAGWWADPELPTTTVVGLGYEQDKALGAIEHLQPSEVWAFFPRSPIPAYTDALHFANKSLLEMMRPQRILTYDVDEPFHLFTRLESLIAGLTSKTNCILLPFGPKIFALCALLASSLHSETAVWRVSGAEEATDRIGHSVYGLSVTLLSRSKGEPSS